MKVGGPGTVIDVPLAHKDNIWSFPHWDTMSIVVKMVQILVNL